MFGVSFASVRAYDLLKLVAFSGLGERFGFPTGALLRVGQSHSS